MFKKITFFWIVSVLILTPLKACTTLKYSQNYIEVPAFLE
jgi:hypothetical protein